MNLIGYGLTKEDGTPLGLWPRPLDDALRARDRYKDNGFGDVGVVPVYAGERVAITKLPTTKKEA